MASIYTYQNTLYKLQMNGWQLRQFMEWSAAFFKTWEPGDVTIAFDSSVRYYLYDAFAGVKYDLDISKQPGNRIQNLTWMDGRPVQDDDSFVVAVNNYRATTQLLAYATSSRRVTSCPSCWRSTCAAMWAASANCWASTSAP